MEEGFRARSSKFANLLVLGAYLSGLGLIFALDTTSLISDSFVLPLTSLIAGVTSFAFCGFCFHGGGLLSRALSWRPLRALGNMSYSFYLVHGLAVGFVKQVVRRLIQPGEHNLAFFGYAVVIAPTIAVRIAPPAPPATTCEIMPPTLRLPDCAAATSDGRASVTI